jgi:inosose dehydratase
VSILRYGTVPILWNNDDVPELTPHVPAERVLDEIKATGFVGTELGSNYPQDAMTLKSALDSRALALSGAYYCPGLADEASAEAALAVVDDWLDFLEAVGCSAVIAAEPVVKERSAIAGRVNEVGTPVYTESQWQTLARSLNELGRRCQERGMTLAFHNHAGTYVETPTEVKRLLNLTDPKYVSLCLDTGHYTYGGGDAAEAAETYINRLAYLHLKDLDATVKAECVRTQQSFMEALRRRVFAELGKGSVDVRRIARMLTERGWSGWVVSEQDTTWNPPLQTAKAHYAALTELFSAQVVNG